jgi:spore germination cell wall hydrolase CwlJ-like protein
MQMPFLPTGTISSALAKQPDRQTQPKSTAIADFRSIPSLRQHLPLTIPEVKNLSNKERNDIECLSWNLYFEIRGGYSNEQIAIAYVPINRIGKLGFGNDICTNVFQYSVHNGIPKHQFSWVNRKLGSEWNRENDAWEKMQKIALSVYQGKIKDTGHGATYFHSIYLQTSWSPHARKFVLGHHFFWS